jgi:hypothetical protein
MFPHTVTVYNKYKDGKADRWQRTVLRGVSWHMVKGAVMRRAGVSPADGVQLVIPCTADAGGRLYLPCKAWTKEKYRGAAWTLQSGDKAVFGECPCEIKETDAELNGEDGLITITAVDTKLFGSALDHWEVSGK